MNKGFALGAISAMVPIGTAMLGLGVYAKSYLVAITGIIIYLMVIAIFFLMANSIMEKKTKNEKESKPRTRQENQHPEVL